MSIGDGLEGLETLGTQDMPEVTASGHCEESAGAIIEGWMNYA